MYSKLGCREPGLDRAHGLTSSREPGVDRAHGLVSRARLMSPDLGSWKLKVCKIVRISSRIVCDFTFSAAAASTCDMRAAGGGSF